MTDDRLEQATNYIKHCQICSREGRGALPPSRAQIKALADILAAADRWQEIKRRCEAYR